VGFSRFHTLLLCQGVLYLVELGVRVCAHGLDSSETDHDDQSEHDRIFDGGRAVFGNQELLYERCEVLHR
jgi:hypothetical protein